MSLICMLTYKYDSISPWFDACFKPSVKHFLVDFSKQRRKSRRDTILLISVALQHAIQNEDWEDVSYARSRLLQFYKEDSLGILIRSRYKESAENEKASLYYLNREVKKGNKSRLNKLAKNVTVKTNDGEKTKRIILSNQEDIEKEVTKYFTKLFHGYHTANGKVGDQPFQPNFSEIDYFLHGLGQLNDHDSDALTRDITLEEVQWAVKESAGNKSPGLDGLTTEFY